MLILINHWFFFPHVICCLIPTCGKVICCRMPAATASHCELSCRYTLLAQSCLALEMVITGVPKDYHFKPNFKNIRWKMYGCWNSEKEFYVDSISPELCVGWNLLWVLRPGKQGRRDSPSCGLSVSPMQTGISSLVH